MREQWEMGTQTMLDRLRNTGTTRDIALELFQSKYRYLIFAIASEYGLNDTEANELLSIVLREVWRIRSQNAIGSTQAVQSISAHSNQAESTGFDP